MRIMFFLIITVIVSLTFSCSDSDPKPKGPVKKGERNLDQLLKDHPDSIPLLYEKGKLLCDSLQWDEARSFVIKAFRLDSNNIETRLLYAEVLLNGINRPVSDWAKSQYHYHKVVEAQPQNTRALVGLASTYTKMGDLETSFKYINDALRIDKRYRDAYILKGTNYWKDQKIDLVKSSYQTAIEMDPDFMQAYFQLGIVYEYEKDEKCLEYYRSAYQLTPNDPGVEYHLAHSLQNFGYQEEARELYRKMATRESRYYSSQALFQLGYMKEFVDEDLDSAAYFYTSATEKQPNYKEAWLNLGICYYKMGNDGLALKKIAEALRIDPEYVLAKEAVEGIRAGK